jgi:glutaredoxin
MRAKINFIKNGVVAQVSLSDITVMWFFRPGCGHCTNMKEAWNKLKESGIPSNIKLHEINTALPENAEISAKYSVSGVPHIIKQKLGLDGKLYVMVYNGDRSTKSMRDWILNAD